MSVEIPKFNRCCFCLPLRPGLLAWGYYKVAAGALIIPRTTLAYIMLCTIVMSFMDANNKYVIFIILYTGIALIVLLLFITDFVATIVFIVGGHKKNVNLIRGFYIFCIGEFIVTILLILVAAGLSLSLWDSSNTTKYLVIYAANLVTLVVQAYFILLMRSEIIKLKCSGEFRFVNNSAEAEPQCMMMSNLNVAEIETV